MGKATPMILRMHVQHKVKDGKGISGMSWDMI